MKYKIVSDDYIVAVGEGVGGIQITDAEYSEIKKMYSSVPTAPKGYQYCLRADNLELELVELPPIEPDEKSTIEDKAEAYDILMGEEDTE